MNKIAFQSVQFNPDTQLENFVKEKVSKLFEQAPSIIRADVTSFEGASGNPKNKFCDSAILSWRKPFCKEK